jgi:hypothetical protein
MPSPLSRFQRPSNPANNQPGSAHLPEDPAAASAAARESQIAANNLAKLQSENEELKRQAADARAAEDSALIRASIVQVASESKALNPEHVYRLHAQDFIVHRSGVAGAAPTVVLKADPTKSPKAVLEPWFQTEGKYLVGPSVPAGAGLGGSVGAPPAAKPDPIVLTTDEGLTRVTRGLTNRMFSPGTVPNQVQGHAAQGGPQVSPVSPPAK